MSIIDRDKEWKERLSPLAYNVTRLGGTERPFSGKHYLEERDGNYHCICCDHLLFTSEMKYNSGCGWPAFYDGIPGAIKELPEAQRTLTSNSRQGDPIDRHTPDGTAVTNDARH